MSSLLKQYGLPYEPEDGNSTDTLEQDESQDRQLQHTPSREQLSNQNPQIEREHSFHSQQRAQLSFQQRDRSHLQMRQRDREQCEQLQAFHREKMQMPKLDREGDQLHQLQSINSLLQDLSPLSSSSFYSNYNHDANNKDTNAEDDMSISDLFGLGLPRGSLMDSKSTHGSPSHRQNLYHGQIHNQTSPNNRFYQQQYEDEHCGYGQTSTSLDVPSSPTSVTTAGSPSTPGSVYSNPYVYSSGMNNSASSHNAYEYSTPTNRSHFQHSEMFTSNANRSNYYGRPIRGSPVYSSECSSPSLDYPHVMGYNGSRSNTPDSETSGISSIDGSLSDYMNCLSLNSSSHTSSYYTPSINSLISSEIDLCSTGRSAALQRIAMKKYLSSQQSSSSSASSLYHRHHHHAHGQPRNYHTDSSRYHVNSLLGSEKSCCSSRNAHVIPLGGSPSISALDFSLDRAARFHRNAAALCDPTCTWSGDLPARTQKVTGYSSKVFFGGVPWDIKESDLISTLKQFGQIRVEWPGKEQTVAQPKGYAYIIFESEKQVKALLSCCTRNCVDGSYYYKISSKRMKGKDVQVIPWILNDSNYIKASSQKLDPRKTVFVGALHGMLTATGLAKIMNDLFGGVIYAGIDTDKHKYPIGSARITFNNENSYMKAVAAAFVEIKAEKKFTKKVQIDPYLEDSLCSGCGVQQGPYFCRELICFRYFCRSCWQWQHAMDSMRLHKPMSRSSKNSQMIGFTPNIGPNVSNSRMLNISGI